MRHHHFCSTRGQTKTDRFCEVLTAGYAADGGMFMPDFEHLPELPWRSWAHLSYAEIVEEILSAFIGTQEIPRGVLHGINGSVSVIFALFSNMQFLGDSNHFRYHR